MIQYIHTKIIGVISVTYIVNYIKTMAYLSYLRLIGNRTRNRLFNHIVTKIRENIPIEEVATWKTKKGNTQDAERIYISKVRTILTNLNLQFKEAGSQQCSDFRIDTSKWRDALLGYEIFHGITPGTATIEQVNATMDGVSEWSTYWTENRDSDPDTSVDEAGSGCGKTYTHTLLLECKKTDSNTIYFNDTCPRPDIYYVVFYTGHIYKKRDDIPAKILDINGKWFVDKDPWISEYSRELNSLKEKYLEVGKKSGIRMSVYPRPTYKASIKELI